MKRAEKTIVSTCAATSSFHFISPSFDEEDYHGEEHHPIIVPRIARDPDSGVESQCNEYQRNGELNPGYQQQLQRPALVTSGRCTRRQAHSSFTVMQKVRTKFLKKMGVGVLMNLQEVFWMSEYMAETVAWLAADE